MSPRRTPPEPGAADFTAVYRGDPFAVSNEGAYVGDPAGGAGVSPGADGSYDTAAGAAVGAAGERVVARYRPHARRLFWPTIVLIALAVACGYYLGRFAEPWQNLAALIAAAVIFVLLWFLPLVSWLACRYTITTRRVIAVRGLLSRERQEVSLRRGFDVTLRRRGLQALFRAGDVTVHTGSEHPLVLRDVPDARLIVAALTDLSERGALDRGGVAFSWNA